MNIDVEALAQAEHNRASHRDGSECRHDWFHGSAIGPVNQSDAEWLAAEYARLVPAEDAPQLVNVPDFGDVQMLSGTAPDTTPRATVPAEDEGRSDVRGHFPYHEYPHPDTHTHHAEGRRDHEYCVPHDHIEPDPAEWERYQAAILATTPAEDEGRLREALAAVELYPTQWQEGLPVDIDTYRRGILAILRAAITPEPRT